MACLPIESTQRDDSWCWLNGFFPVALLASVASKIFASTLTHPFALLFPAFGLCWPGFTMSKDRITYVRSSELPANQAFSRLMDAIRQNKQDKAPVGQWVGWIKSLTQKGVKQSEIADTEILKWLESRAEADPKWKLSRQDMLDHLQRRLPTIKVVDLARPQFQGWQSLSGGEYNERLYILASESMVIDDQIEDVLYRIQDLGFDPTPLMEDPLLVDRLEEEMLDLKRQKSKAWDFQAHHFSSSVKDHGKNLLAHARTNCLKGNFFIQEIQSDWAQCGRRAGWPKEFPEAPFVTNTEQWAGLVINDLLQTAARRSDVKQVTWVRAHMRNGWNQQNSSDNLAEFYDNIVRRIVEKRLSKTDAKVRIFDVTDKNGSVQQVMGFEMTEQARQSLRAAYPLYSRDRIVSTPQSWMDDVYENDIRARVMKECEVMLGGAHMVRFFNRLYDIASGSEVAGRYIKDTIELSWRAQDPIRVARHESMHFAYDHMLLPHERWVLDDAFAPGSDMNIRTQQMLLDRGLKEAARESRDSAQECAAYAFEYWARGEFDVSPQPRGIFEKVAHALADVGSWIRKLINPLEQQTAEEVFEALKTGVLAARQRVEHEQAQAEKDRHVQAG